MYGGGCFYCISNGYNLINYIRLTCTGEYNAIWFLLCLFVVDILVSIAVYLGKEKLWLQVLFLFVIEAVLIMMKSINIPFLFNVYYYLPFFVVGWIVNRCSLNKLFESPIIGGIWILIFLILIPLFTFQQSPLVLRIPLALSGTMALWFCCFNVTKRKVVSLLEIIGKYTLAIYCIHVCMMNNIDYLMHQWVILDVVFISSISIVIAFLCIGISKILSYSPITDLLFNGHIQK